MSPDERIRVALDPAHSVVVEACAGSGKTWLLVSRLLRLLLAGVRPGEVLAITYTRKAAREIEERLRQWLRVLAVAPDAEVLDFLGDRGLSAEAAAQLLPRARGLLEGVFAAEPPMVITTFHGWFARLLGGAPLVSGLAAYRLVDAEGPLLEEAWARFARRCAAEPAGEPAQALLRLFSRVGSMRTRGLLEAFVGRRAEWQAFVGEASSAEEALAGALNVLRADLGVTQPGQALPAFLARPGLKNDVDAYASILDANTDSDRRRAAALRSGWAEVDPAARFDALRSALLTQKGDLRACKSSLAQSKRLGVDVEARLIELHQRLGAAVQAAADAMLEEEIFVLNSDILCAALGLLEALDAHKRDSRAMDFGDLEWHTDRLLGDPEQAPYLQARLDARYRHLLLDEFQDTNPLQWRILLSWLDAYGAEDAGPRIFLVGDPKQSIYRFRRADHRIFRHAARWLMERSGARLLENDRTFRNAPAVVDVVNELFAHEPAFVGFRAQTAVRTELPGRVEILPLCADAEEAGEGADPGRLRDPLREPPLLAENLRRQAEAGLLARRIGDMVGRWPVHSAQGMRPAAYGDVLILTRRRSVLPDYERALRDAGIPYLSVSRGGLLKTLEAADLAALLRFLSSPMDDLALVHALRTPIFGLSDGDLLDLAARTEAGWWARLGASAAEGADDARHRAHGLLERWRAAAASLPVHDLLDRIFHEGEVPARYAAVVPPAMAAGVRANLEAFIALALELDGGRYPSLPRFMDELSRLAQAGDDEAPDEGVILADGDATGRVRIMTIHGAKGLEAPIVWLVDARNARRRADTDCVLLDWPPGAMAPRHFSFATRKDERGRRREALFAEEDAAREREDLNLLYVAITRASQYFFASGIVPAQDSASASSPWQRLAASLARLGNEDGAHGPTPGLLVAPSAPMDSGGPAKPDPEAVAVGALRVPDAAGAGADFGTAFHLAMECLSEGRALPALDPVAVELAQRTFARPELAPFFDVRRHAWACNELEFVTVDGRVGRMDRVLELEGEIWILDYKTGSPPPELLAAYAGQLQGYRAAAAGLWPGRPVRTALLFGGGELLELG